MHVDVLKALKGSIRKWERIVAGKGKDHGADNCPLCALFNNEDTAFPCRGCPVSARTEKWGCDGTPYDQYREHESKANAKAELDFLKSLLPEESRACDCKINEGKMASLPRGCQFCGVKLMHYGSCDCVDAQLSYIDTERKQIAKRLKELSAKEKALLKGTLTDLGVLSCK